MRYTRSASVGLLALVFLLLVGCASTPAGRYSQMNDSFIAVTETLITAREVGQITAVQWEDDILPLLEEGNTLLTEQRAIIDAGGDPFELFTLLDSVIDRLLIFATQIEGES